VVIALVEETDALVLSFGNEPTIGDASRGVRGGDEMARGDDMGDVIWLSNMSNSSADSGRDSSLKPEDRVRRNPEVLILSDEISDARVLDLFFGVVMALSWSTSSRPTVPSLGSSRIGALYRGRSS
jgi:hypothetical protein